MKKSRIMKNPSYSPDGSRIVFDRYPDRARVAAVMVSDAKNRKDSGVKTVARVFAPFKYDNDTRCDLHPRWNRAGDKVCFDSVFEGHRGLYVEDVPKEDGAADKVDYENRESRNTTVDCENCDIKYSIITPAYNSFDLMKRYFDSLLHQTYKNFEVILVDDCSTDGSYEKLVEYQKTSSLKMTVLKAEKNSGPGNARNMGMDAATGEWVTFIDNDDWVETGFLERITAVIKRENVDCVIYDYYIQREGKEKTTAISVIGAAGGRISTAKCVMSVTNHTFGKFYKLTNCVGKGIKFPDTRRCEDIAFTAVAVSECKKIYYLEEPMYFYYQRGDSLSNNKVLGESDLFTAFKILQDKLEKQYPNEIKEKSVRDLLYAGVLLMCKAGRSSKKIMEFIDDYEKKYPDWYRCKMVHMVGKAKLAFLMCIRHRKIAALRLMSDVHTRMITG